MAGINTPDDINFNPRSPHGERLDGEDYTQVIADMISTHAPRTGSDVFCFVRKQRISNHFNPRSPHGERQL